MKINNPMSAASRTEIKNKQLLRKKNTPKIPFYPALITMIILAVICFAVGTRFSGKYAATSLDYSKLEEIYATLHENYIGEIDDEVLIDGAASGMVEALGDKYTEFFTAKEAAEFNSDLNGTLIGVGIQLGQNEQKQLEVIAPIDNSPAKKAGILAGDIIVKINGEDSINDSPDVAVNKIRGKENTQVTLTISRNGEQKDYELTRANITIPSTTWKISTDGGATWVANNADNFDETLESKSEKIGYIRVSQFSDDTVSLAKNAAKDMDSGNIDKIILDLRANGGGYVSAAQGLASIWLPYGKNITEEIGKNGITKSTITASGNPLLNRTETIVLIDGGSASASEIVAAALKDNGSATLLGKTSYGKGVMQQLIDLSNGAQLKVTIAKWMTPKGKNINESGIKPDIEIELTEEQLMAGNDTQIKAAVDELLK